MRGCATQLLGRFCNGSVGEGINQSGGGGEVGGGGIGQVAVVEHALSLFGV